jgi:hypothetical protein
MRLEYVKLNEDNTFSFEFVDDITQERKVVRLTDDEIALLNHFHTKIHRINGAIQDFTLGGEK